MDFAELWDRLVSVLYPPRCILCDEVVAYDDLVCGRCAGRAPYGRVACRLPHRFVDALAAVAYSGNVRRAVWAVKERGDRRSLRYFAGEMAALVAACWPDVPFDLLVPVPASPAKLRDLGFNHAGLLAEEVGCHVGLPVSESVLHRREGSQVQHQLTAEQRRANAAASYCLEPEGAAQVSGRTILLVDDVFTTGATLAACTDCLLAAGAEAVYALTATRTD